MIMFSCRSPRSPTRPLCSHISDKAPGLLQMARMCFLIFSTTRSRERRTDHSFGKYGRPAKFASIDVDISMSCRIMYVVAILATVRNMESPRGFVSDDNAFESTADRIASLDHGDVQSCAAAYQLPQSTRVSVSFRHYLSSIEIFEKLPHGLHFFENSRSSVYSDY